MLTINLHMLMLVAMEELSMGEFIEMQNNSLNIPKERKVDNFTRIPYVIVGDDAFPRKPFLMKPYPERNLSIEQRIFGYRLSRARRVVENGFGILANRFRVFLSPLSLTPENVEKVALASCALHNFFTHEISISLYSVRKF